MPDTVSGNIRIASKGVSFAIIVATDDDGKEAATSLAKYLNLTTGAVFPIAESPAGKTPVTIYVRKNKIGSINAVSKLAELDAYSITFPDKHSIVIAGNSSWAVQYGTYDFLERYSGVRWLFPGLVGEHVPFHATMDVPVKNVYMRPRFSSRLLSGLKEELEIIWADKNRMRDSGIKFHHNLSALFPTSRFGESNPEFYPLINGKRFVPGAGVKTGWQPCFSAPGSVQAAAKMIDEYFQENPDAISYSLGVNDRGGFCECERCQRRVNNKVNFLGQPDYSALYYSWVNAVVTEVLKTYPNKWFGCLAYSSVASPPDSFSLHPNVIPYLTSDRLKWLKPDMEKREKKINQAWEEKATTLGWYDYMYGKAYLLPRIYISKMSDYLQYAAEHKVSFLYSEAYPNWGEGPKLYLALRMQWDPNVNVKETLKDWYVSAVGEEAAPYLAAYFEFWEDFWVNRATASPWFGTKGPYLNFKSMNYLRIVKNEDFLYCRQLLDLAKQHAKTVQQKERAEYFIRSLADYESSVAQAKSLFGKAKKVIGKIKEYADKVTSP